MASSSSAARIDPELVISHKFLEESFSYSERDAAIYALGVGACAGDAVDEKELKYVYHRDGQRSIEENREKLKELLLCRSLGEKAKGESER